MHALIYINEHCQDSRQLLYKMSDKLINIICSPTVTLIAFFHTPTCVMPLSLVPSNTSGASYPG